VSISFRATLGRFLTIVGSLYEYVGHCPLSDISHIDDVSGVVTDRCVNFMSVAMVWI